MTVTIFKPQIISFIIYSSAILLFSGFAPNNASERVIGVWESEEKNLQIEIFEEDGKFAGRMVYFKCSSNEIMENSLDTENPDKTLTGRKLLGLKLVSKLSYEGNDVWSDGKIYDPNSGHTFEARIQMTGSNTAIVRGYWKFKWLGRSMVFHRK